jgi:hypothetical protein
MNTRVAFAIQTQTPRMTTLRGVALESRRSAGEGARREPCQCKANQIPPGRFSGPDTQGCQATMRIF